MLTSTALSAARNLIIGSIAYARYKTGGIYHTAAIYSAGLLSDGRVSVTFIMNPEIEGNEATVTEVQLCDSSHSVWAQKDEHIVLGASNEGILYRFAFTVTVE